MSLEKNVEQIFQSTRYACVYINPADLSISDTNLAAQRLFGFSGDELCVRKLTEIVLNEPDHLKKEIALASAGHKRSVILEAWDARQGERSRMQAGVISHDSPKDGKRLAVIIPLSSAEAKSVYTAETFIQSLLEAMPDAVLALDEEGDVMACNWKFQQMWRVPRMLLEKGVESKLNEHMTSLIKPGMLLPGSESDFLTGSEVFDRLYLKDGRTLEYQRRPILSSDQKKSWVISFKDVSSVHDSEKLLYEALQEVTAIIDASMMGVVFIKKGKITKASIKAEEMFGYSKNELTGMKAQSLFSSESGQGPSTAQGGEALDKGVFMSERQFKRKDGSKFWARLTGKALDISAPASGAVWIIDDITERRRADEKIQLATTVFDNISEGIIITNNQGNIQFVNPAFTQVTGYDPVDVIGKPPSVLQSGKHDKEFYHDMWQRLVDRGSWQGEIWNRRKSGEIFAEWLSITAMKNTHGETTNYAGIFNDITYKKENEELVRHLAFHDPLTQLPNRRMFLERMEIELSHAKRDKELAAVMFMDLDNFKDINDTYGHNAGDFVLQAAAERISSCLRESDSVSRFGGDEFTVLTPKIRTPDDAGAIARKIIEALMGAQVNLGQGKTVNIQTSMGISVFPDDGHTSEDLLNKADRAMYFAKKDGRHSFHFFNSKVML
ncbi:MAG: diguanylate cyclase [Nitrospinota bacterium]|nr:diguanylate cyclase [Nitrospinota bacterium]